MVRRVRHVGLVAVMLGLVCAPAACTLVTDPVPPILTSNQTSKGEIIVPKDATPADDGNAPISVDSGADGFAPVDAGRDTALPSCSDGVKNGLETDVDCGGLCKKCSFGKRCAGADDCASQKCTGTGTEAACSCPDDMVAIPKPGGDSAYCMDRVEVTWGEYARFLSASPSLASQPAECSTNTTYVPTSPAPGAPLDVTCGVAVTGVDWCDATAYCKFSGKVLCGDLGGAATSAAADSTQGAWYNACSAQGVFPDGTPGTACNVTVRTQRNRDYDVDCLVRGEITDFISTPVGLAQPRTCQGGYVNLFQMTGNVGEWENSCTGGTCRVRGLTQSCTSNNPLQRLDNSRSDVGIRCCQH